MSLKHEDYFAVDIGGGYLMKKRGCHQLVKKEK